VTLDQTLDGLLGAFFSSVEGADGIVIATEDGVPLDSCPSSRVDVFSLPLFGSIIATASANVTETLKLGEYRDSIINAGGGKIVVTMGKNYCIVVLFKSSGNLGLALLRLKELQKSGIFSLIEKMREHLTLLGLSLHRAELSNHFWIGGARTIRASSGAAPFLGTRERPDPR